MSYTAIDDEHSEEGRDQTEAHTTERSSISNGTHTTALSTTDGTEVLLLPPKKEARRASFNPILVPPPPSAFYKLEDKFVYDDIEKEDLEAEEEVPTDPYHLYFIAFMVLGAGFHLPFNSFVAAVDYFMITYDRNNMAFVIAATYTYTTCCAVVANVLLVNKISTHRRILFGYGAFFVSLAMMAVLVACTSAGLIADKTGFAITILATFLTGVGGGVQEASFYGYAGMLPSKYTRAVMLGESFAGLMVSINRIVTKLSIDSPITNTIIFFSLSIVGEIICILLHYYIKGSPLVRYYEKETRIDLLYLPIAQVVTAARQSIASYVSAPRPVLLDCIKSECGNIQSHILHPCITAHSKFPEGEQTVSPYVSMSKSEHGGVIDAIKTALKMRWDISKRIWKLMIGILQVYFVSLLLYPGLASVIPSSWKDGWLPVILIATFNLSDFFGTLLTGLSWTMTDNMLLFLGAVRWCLIPFLLLCVLPLSNPVFTGEVIPITIIFILGLTTGYMGSTPMCAAAGKVKVAWREMTGNLMTMMMLMGLTLGATSALGLNAILGVDLNDAI